MTKHTNKQERMIRELEDFRAEAKKSIDGVPEEVERILACVHDHLFDPHLNVNRIKQLCRLKNNNVSTRFRWCVGSGIKEHIEALRMRAAARLLTQKDLEVFLIAMTIGYSYQETFCRAFHRNFGCTPLEFRLRPVSLPWEEAVSRQEGKRIRQSESSVPR